MKNKSETSKQTFKIFGRSGPSCTLIRLNRKRYLLSFILPYIRCGYSEDAETIEYVDPCGGPFISVGTPLKEYNTKLPNKKITSINWAADGKYYVIEIE